MTLHLPVWSPLVVGGWVGGWVADRLTGLGIITTVSPPGGWPTRGRAVSNTHSVTQSQYSIIYRDIFRGEAQHMLGPPDITPPPPHTHTHTHIPRTLPSPPDIPPPDIPTPAFLRPRDTWEVRGKSGRGGRVVRWSVREPIGSEVGYCTCGL